METDRKKVSHRIISNTERNFYQFFDIERKFWIFFLNSLYKRRRTTWILLAWSVHLKLHPCWLLIGWLKNCIIQAFSEGLVLVNFWVAKKCKNQTLSEGQGIVSIFGLQKKCTIETFWECVGFISRILSFFCSPGTTFLEGKGGNPSQKLAQTTTFFEEVGLDPSKQ